MDTLATRLKAAREAAHLTERALSKAAGLSPTHVGLIESGARPTPSAETLGALADVLGVGLDWLARGRGEAPAFTQNSTPIAEVA